MEERVGRQVGREELALLELAAGEVGLGRGWPCLLLVAAVDLHPCAVLVVVVVVLLCRVDDLAQVGIVGELVLPLVLELAHALVVEGGTVSRGRRGGRLGRGAVADGGGGALAHGVASCEAGRGGAGSVPRQL